MARKLRKRIRRHTRLDHDVASELFTYREARLLHRGLDVHVVVDHIGDKLRVRKRLIHAAHDAETNVLVAVLHKGGNDGVERTLVTGERIGRFAIDREESTAILKNEPHALDRNIRSEGFRNCSG